MFRQKLYNDFIELNKDDLIVPPSKISSRFNFIVLSICSQNSILSWAISYIMLHVRPSRFRSNVFYIPRYID